MNICVIPCRAGSKRITGKNKREFHGKPIYAYSIEIAVSSRLFGKIVVSSDDLEILDNSRWYGATDLLDRPEELCRDDVGTWDVVKHAVKTPAIPNFRYVCCLYPTAPMSHADDLKRGYSMCLDYGFYHSVSVGYPPLQDAGQWYWSSERAIENDIDYFDHRTALVKIPAERVIDINTMDDWYKAEIMYSRLHGLPIDKAHPYFQVRI